MEYQDYEQYLHICECDSKTSTYITNMCSFLDSQDEALENKNEWEEWIDE